MTEIIFINPKAVKPKLDNGDIEKVGEIRINGKTAALLRFVEKPHFTFACILENTE